MRTVVALALASLSATARADGTFVEGDLGFAAPIGDDEYDDVVDTSIKLAARIGSRSGTKAFDVSLDFTPVSDNVNNLLIDIDFQRYRLMFGARHEHLLGPKTRLVFRGAAGIDLVRASGEVLGVEYGETDVGLALEVSAGVMFDVGSKAKLGGKLGLPMAFHFDDNDPDDPDDGDFEYTGIDLDFMFVLSVDL